MTENTKNDLKDIENKFKFVFDNLRKYKDIPKPQESDDIIQNIELLLTTHYLYTIETDDDLKNKTRTSISAFLANSNYLDTLASILSKSFEQFFGSDYSIDCHEKIYFIISYIFDVLINSTDASMEVGQEICKNNDLLNLLYKAISELKQPCMDGRLSKVLKLLLNFNICEM